MCQVTEAKGRLESALVAAREMQSDAAALSRWLDGVGARLGPQGLELEMSRMQALRDNLNANLAAWQRLADPADPQQPAVDCALTKHVDALNKRWDLLKRSAAQTSTPTTTSTTDNEQVTGVAAGDTTVSMLLFLPYI